MEIKRACIGIDCKGASEGAGRAVFARFDAIDADGDVTKRGAFGRQTAKLVPAHNWSAPNIGAAAVSENTEGAIADFQFYLKMPSALEWYESLRGNAEHGIQQQWSYGYNVLASSRGTFQGKSVRFLERVEVFEVSPVLLGAQAATQLLDLKACRNCGAIESPRIEPQAHACSCGAKANGHESWRDDPLLARALAGQTDPLRRAQVRLKHWETMSETGRRLAPLNGHGGRY